MEFRERLWVPLSWWLLAMGFAVSLLLAIGLHLGWIWGATVAGASALVAGALFWGLASEITVSRNEVRVGRARIDVRFVGNCVALDRDQTRWRGGPGADARAYLVLRPYLATAVELEVNDVADPAPYWLVGTRRPAELAAAVSAVGNAPGDTRVVG